MKIFKEIKELSKILREFPKEFIISIVYGCFSSIFGVASLVLGAFLTSIALMGDGSIHFKPYFILMFFLIVGKGLFSYLEMYEVHLLAYLVIENIRGKIYDAILRSSLQTTQGQRTGTLTSITMEDVETLEVFFAHTLGNYIVAIICSIAYVSTLAKINGTLALIVLVATILIASIPYWFEKYGRRLGDETRILVAKVNSDTIDTVQGLREILNFGREELYIEKIIKDTSAVSKVLVKDGNRKGLQSSIINVIMSMVLIAVISLSHTYVIKGSMDVFFVPITIILALYIFGPIVGVSGSALNITMISASAKRILDLINEKDSVTNLKEYNQKETFTPDIRFEQVSFSYDKENKVLNNLSFNIQEGEHIAITGESGVGKTTIANLIMKFYEVDEGEIFIGGKSYNDVHEKNIRDHIAYVSQDTYLFKMSIKENIRLANPVATDKDIEEAAKLSMAHVFISKLEEGYDTMVGERGITLSGGEKQRLSIARAILKGAPILVMDEAASNLDSESEALFRDALSRLENKTIITIAHRDSTIKDADRVLRLEDGGIVFEGSPREYFRHGY